MAIIPGSQKTALSFASVRQSKQNRLLFLLCFIVGAAAVIYFMSSGGGFLSQTVPPPTDKEISDANLAAEIGTLNFKFDVLKNDTFNSLVSHANPVTIGEKGRANPFVAF